jgi:hypothetical protein
MITLIESNFEPCFVHLLSVFTHVWQTDALRHRAGPRRPSGMPVSKKPEVARGDIWAGKGWLKLWMPRESDCACIKWARASVIWWKCPMIAFFSSFSPSARRNGPELHGLGKTKFLSILIRNQCFKPIFIVWDSPLINHSKRLINLTVRDAFWS